MSSKYMYMYNYSMKMCALSVCVCVCEVCVKCVLCQYEQDDGGHRQESQQYNDHDSYTSPQRIVL